MTTSVPGVRYQLPEPRHGRFVMQQRSQQYGKPGTFTVDRTVRQAIDEASDQGRRLSHRNDLGRPTADGETDHDRGR